MQTLTQSYLQSFIIWLQQFLVYLWKIWLPSLSSHCVKDSWKIEGTTVYYFVLFTQSIHIAIRHPAELSEQLRIQFIFNLMNEGPKMFVSRYPDPFVIIFEKWKVCLCQWTFSLLRETQFWYFKDDVNAGLANGPVTTVSCFCLIKREESAEELFAY